MIKYISESKNIKYFDKSLCLYYGIGLAQQNKINNLFGLGASGFISVLDKSFIVKIELFLREHYLLDDYLKIIEITNIKFLQHVKCYRGLRHKWKLPINGQRTRSNAKTVRKLSRVKLQKYIHDVYRLK
jgi:small subunit ribosomal protein S13